METPLLDKIAAIDQKMLAEAIRRAAPRSALGGAGLGGAVGAIAGGSNRGQGALEGALLGAPVGAAIGTGAVYKTMRETTWREALKRIFRNLKHAR